MADPTTAATNLPTGLGAIYDLIRGITGGDISSAKTAAGMADPLNQYRGQAGGMLMNLLTNPGSFSLDPGQQFSVQQGQQAISTAANAQTSSSDPTRTGSLGPALAKYTEGYANQAFDTRIQQLFNIASGNPAAAGALYAGGTANQQSSLAGGLTGIGQMLAPLLAQLGIPKNVIDQITNGGSGAMGAIPDPNADTGINAIPPDPNSPFANDPIDFSAPLPDLTGNMGLPDFGSISGGFPDLSTLFGG